ncbi:peptide-methionine (S)-S-oxide reductase [Candidatus Uhrbacteria bacterium]|nr:MAG: peptide-methionine (S)-S-oxide reductase [Candidatus Uhrbacteria bacterium]
MKTQSAVFAGGCFWGMEELFRKQPGVTETEAGYAGGKNENPTYEHHPGHAEALKVTYDPEKTSFRNLLDFFFQIHDPTTLNRQGNDVGSSYRSAIFYENEEQKKEAEAFIDLVNKSGRWSDPVVTTVEPLTNYTKAEEYHQNYLQKNPGGYTCHFVRPGGSYLQSAGVKSEE